MKYLLLLFISLSMCSCGLVQRLTTSTHKKDQSKTDSTTRVHKDSSGTTKTVITEKKDTTIGFKADTTKGHSTIDSLKKHDIQVTNGHTSIDVHLDTTTGKITATAISKARKKHVLIDKVTETTSQSKVTTDASNEVKKQTKINDTTKSLLVKKSGLQWHWWLIGALILLIVAYFTLRYFKL